MERAYGPTQEEDEMREQKPVIELVKALNKFQSALRSVPKSSVNPFFSSRYADLDAVWDACRKPLAENGLALVQTTEVTDGRLFLITTLFHTSGECIEGRYPITPMKQEKGHGWATSEDPQSIGSAITYARRYAMCAILGVSAEEDDDGNLGGKPPPATKTPASAPRMAQEATKAPQGEVQAGKSRIGPNDVPEPKIIGELLNNCLKVYGLNKAATLQLLGLASPVLITDVAATWYKVQQKMAAKAPDA